MVSQDLMFSVSLQVSDILGKFPDLMDGFNDFLARCESLGKSLIRAKLPYFFLQPA
jgi:hypothetical protein